MENAGSYPMAEATSELYMVNMESDKAVRQDFAANALEYAKANGIEAYESITAESGGSNVTFEYAPLGIYVVDTAGKARITVMWDMDWESEIKESYKSETETTDTSTEIEEKTEIQQDAADNTEENSADENMEADTPMETEGEEYAVEDPLSAGEEAPETASKAPVMIVVVGVVLALVVGMLFIKNRNK